MPKIKISPLSINQAFQGRRFLTKNAEKYIRDVCLQLPKREMIKGWIELRLIFYVKNFGGRDVDNMCKIVQDCLTKKKYYEDDRKIARLIAEKKKSKIEGFDFYIKNYK